MRRRFDPAEPELMDLPQPVSRELEDDLSSLEWLNRRFGAHRFLGRFLDAQFARRRRLRILDLATGAGDLPRVAAEWGRRRGVAVGVDALDLQPSTLEVARARASAYPEIAFHRHDVREPWRGGGYDLVISFLALHHFSEDDARRVLTAMARHAAAARLVVDLERSRAAAIGVHLLTQFVLTAPMTRHDARVSVRRAFSLPELAGLARESGWRISAHRRVFLFRQALSELPA